MADISNYYPARHAPQASIDPNPDWFGRTQVSTISRPAMDTDVSGTGSMLSGVHQGGNKGRPQSLGSVSSLESPLDTADHTDIISAAGLGRRAPAGKSRAEEDSDASAPNQTVKTGANGGMTHYRRNPATGTVRKTPIGAQYTPANRKILGQYPNLNHTPGAPVAARPARPAAPPASLAGP